MSRYFTAIAAKTFSLCSKTCPARTSLDCPVTRQIERRSRRSLIFYPLGFPHRTLVVCLWPLSLACSCAGGTVACAWWRWPGKAVSCGELGRGSDSVLCKTDRKASLCREQLCPHQTPDSCCRFRSGACDPER